MSACISRHGEYSEHEPDDDLVCQLCGVLDEAELLARARRARGALAYIDKSLDNVAGLDPELVTWTNDEVVEMLREVRAELEPLGLCGALVGVDNGNESEPCELPANHAPPHAAAGGVSY